MKKLTKVILACLLLCFTTSYVYAVPLLVDEVTKLKFTNYENVTDMQDEGEEGYGIISAGDMVEGIAILTTISDTATINPDILWDAGSSAYEITAHFKFYVTEEYGAELPIDSPPELDTTGSVAFGLGTDGFMRVYTDASKDWAPDSVALSDAISSANNGDLWWSTEASEYFDGFNISSNTTVPGGNSTESANSIWGDLTVNNTGYIILSQLYPDAAGIADPTNNISDWYLNSNLFFNNNADGVTAFSLRSEDPVYMYATVPEPTTMMLLGIGLLGISGVARRKN